MCYILQNWWAWIKDWEAAKTANKNPQEFVDDIVVRFKELKETLNLSNDDILLEQQIKDILILFKKHIKNYMKKGYIYESVYEGLLCVGCEGYFTNKDLVDECPIHQKSQ